MDADAKEAVRLAEEIANTIEDSVSDRAKSGNADFFESVLKRSKDIAETVTKRQTATDKQITALENMLAGVQRWVHDD